jgi:hypothetical protein
VQSPNEFQQQSRKGCGCFALTGCGFVALLVCLILIGAVFGIFKGSEDEANAAAVGTGMFSAEALKTIPASYITAYQVASANYGVPATFLAAIGQQETQNGHEHDAGVYQPSCSTASPCHVLASSPSDAKALSNSAGAAGPMQIGICCGNGGGSPPTASDEFSNGHAWGGESDSVWHGALHPVVQEGCAGNNPGVGEDANGDGVANVYDIRDAACSAAKRLTRCWDGALEHLWQMAYAYYHGCGHNPPDSARTTDSYTSSVMNHYNQFTDWTTPVSFTGNASTLGQAAVQVAMRQLGKPYVWGADGPSSFDCSGLTYYAYKQVGYNWTRMTAQGQLQWLRAHHAELPFNKSTPANLVAGDLVFYGSSTDPHHVEMYMGTGQMVEAPHTGDVVKVVPFPGDSDAIAAARPAAAR